MVARNVGLLHDGIERQRSPNICLNFEIKIPHEDNICVLFLLTKIVTPLRDNLYPS